ncbi:ELWxxDGT repeat protein [Solirubrobacter pauli]|uniref:ELWxxDGT repeat protein n=1 Tax=Solirubrobacter pauli TaxID=166793 RepID=UPI001B85BEF6|nr:ELWxxDGT repeat protein [Solirubrobacter pauli]
MTALLALAAPAAAQDDVGLLKALGTWTQPSDPADVVALADGTAVFSAEDAIHGRELWRTDGTAAGTQLVSDLVPGPEGSFPVALEAVGDLAYFYTVNGVWRTDGTSAGTRRLVDFRTASGMKARTAAAENEPVRQRFQPLGDGVLFVQPDAYSGEPELWHLRPSGAKKLDLFDDPQLGRQLTVSAAVDGKVLLTGTYSQYLTDGTREGTQEVYPGVGFAPVKTTDGHLASYGSGGSLVVLRRGETKSTVVSPGLEYAPLRAIGDAVYFAAEDGLRRWTAADGVTTLGGPPPAWSETGGEQDIERSGSTIFWTGSSGSRTRLARWDGQTAAVVPGPAYGLTRITAAGPGTVLFWAYDEREEDGERVLWLAGATGMQRVPGEVLHGDWTYRMAKTRNGVVYPAWTEHGDLELHRSDGTPGGTGQLGDVNPLPKGSEPYGAARVGARVLFPTAERGELWVTDGTAAGTTTVRALDSTGAPLDPVWMDSDGTTAYFLGGNDRLLYQSDGTAAGTRPIAGPFNGFLGLGRVGAAFVFGTDGELWRTDGTAAGTYSLGETYAGEPVAVNGDRSMLVTSGYWDSIWTDGTRTARLPTGRSIAGVAVPGGFLAGMELGSPDDSTLGTELYRLDETATRAELLADLEPGKTGSVPRGMTRAGDRVVFVAGTSAFGTRWYSTDLSGGGLQPLPIGGAVSWPYAWETGRYTYITAWSSDPDRQGMTLYRTDGTPAGTVALRFFPFDDNEHAPLDFTAFGDTVWFSAWDPEHGRELWKTDGTPAGTRMAADILPGPDSSDPADLLPADDFLYFSAFNLEHGAEPWRVWRPRPSAEAPGEPAPPVTIEPLPVPLPLPPAADQPAARRDTLPLKVERATVSVTVKRLRGAGARKRWRVSGRVAESGCSGRLRIDVNRGQRRVKSTTARLRRCRFDAIVTTTARGPRLTLTIRTVPTSTLVAARSRTVRLR